MSTKIGEYRVRAGTANIKFWPLPPGSTIASATPPLPSPPVAPTASNVVVLPPAFGIFDVVVQFTDDPTRATIPPPTLPSQVSGAATTNVMPLVLEPDGTARICFAVAPASGAQFDGVLRLTAQRTTPPATATLDLPIRVAVGTVVDDLFVLFVVRPAPTPPQTYAWVKLKAVEQSNQANGVAGAAVTCKVLRDNQTYRSINRRASLTTTADGFVARNGRKVLGLPINWPLLFNVRRAGFQPRGHMIRLAAGDIHHNLAPHVPAVAVQLTAAHASLATRRVLLDAGHGVVYALASARRSQEWFVAHRVLDRIAQLLTTEHAMPVANVLRTRTAGLGLIEPTQVGSNAAPETGATRYVLELSPMRVRVQLPSLGLRHISDLVLTQHGPTGAALPVSAADRTRLLTVNAATLANVTARLNAQHGPSRRVRPGSIRWDAAASRYQYTHEPVAPAPATAGVDATLPITTGDWFVLDAAMLRALAERSARWSLACEIGSGPGASGARPSFTDAARATMTAANAVGYMRDKILEYLNVAAPHPYLNHGPRAWGPAPRMDYMNANACDLNLTLHENAGGGVGGMCLVSGQGGADAPPQDQIRIGKIFTKYLDGFDQGVRQGGVAVELASNPVGMLHGGNQVRDRYAYFELEFMDAIDPDNPNNYRYHQMVTGAFVETVSRQIVDGIVEVLLNRQSDLDGVTLNSALPLW